MWKCSKANGSEILRGIFWFSNTFLLYKHGVQNQTFQFYSHLPLWKFQTIHSVILHLKFTTKTSHSRPQARPPTKGRLTKSMMIYDKECCAWILPERVIWKSIFVLLWAGQRRAKLGCTWKKMTFSSFLKRRTKGNSERHAKYILYPTPQQWDYISCDYNKDMTERKIYSRHWWFCTKEFLIMANKKMYHEFIVTTVMHYAQLVEKASSWVILWIIIKHTI